MIKLSLPLLFVATSFLTHASDFSTTGARYAAQGNTLTANANDTFALSVNPANLLSHGLGNYKEIAANFNSYKLAAANNAEPEQELDFQYIGGFTTRESWVFGGYMSSIPEPIYLKSKKNDKWQTANIEQWGISVAWGSVREDEDEIFDWGIGGSLDLLSGTDSNDVEVSLPDYQYTIGGKLRHHSSMVFRHNAIDMVINVAASYSSEAVTGPGAYQKTTIRPQTSRVALSTLFAHSSESFSWDLTLTGEYVSQSATYIPVDSPIPPSYGNELRIGSEFMLVQPFGGQFDIAFRTGVIKQDNIEQSMFNSFGIGFSSESWSFDFAAQESARIAEEMHYNLSITYKL